MKKLLALGLLSFSLAQAKVFVGVDGGYVMAGSSVSGKADSTVWDGTYDDAWSVSANVGYETFFSNNFGMRAFLAVGYGTYLDSLTSNQAINIDGNLDLILNFVNTGSFGFGVFAGVGAGYQYNSFLDDKLSFHSIPLFGRAGVTFGFGEKVRLDLTARLPIIAWDAKDSVGSGILPTIYSPVTMQAGVKFLF